MSAGTNTDPVSVSGGAASIAADCEDMIATASLTASISTELDLAAVRLHAHLLDIDRTTTLLDPDGAIRFEAALLAALDGPHGLTALAARTFATQVALVAAARSYLEVDQLRTDLLPYYELANDHSRYAVDVAARVLADQRVLAAAGLAYPDGHPVLTPKGVDGDMNAPPRSVQDLLRGLARRNSGADGEVGVQILTGTDADGRSFRKIIVDLPGTKDWVGGPVDSDVANVGTNLRAMAQEPTTYEAGVIAALKATGVGPQDDVTIVGHSLGGTVAVNTARDLVAQGHNVTHVITAGAPASQVLKQLPSSVQVLAIENADDIVPHLDGSPNPDLGNVTTVTVNHPHSSIGADHDLDKSYVPGAGDVDASDDPSVRAYLDGLEPQLDASTNTTYTYVITRGF